MKVWNDCYLEGNVGRDATAKVLSGGQHLTTFTMAVNQGKNKEPMWLTIKHFNQHGPLEIRKGQKVSVRGRLFFDQWNDQEGKQRQSWGIIADIVDEQRKEEDVF